MEFPPRNKTTWPNKDTGPNPEELYETGLIQEMDIRDMGWVAASNYFMEHLSHVGELKRDEGAKEALTELKSLMRGRHIRGKSPGNLKVPGTLTDRIGGR